MPPGAHPDAATFPTWLRRRELGQDSDEHLNWAIADRETDHALGNMTVFRLDPVANRFQAEIGYWLHPTARGRGVLGEVMPAIVDHAFAPVADGGMGLSRLYAETDLDNGPSQAVLLRAGFRRWGQDRYAFRNGAGDVTDGAYFELLATDERLDRRPQRVDEVTLEGDRVRLRPWRDDDAERVVEGCTDPRSMHWLSGLPNPYTSEHAGDYIRRCRGQAAVGAGLFLAMADPQDDACVGSIALMDLGGMDPTTGEVGYWAHPAARGRGMTSEAVALLSAHAFRPTTEGGLGLRRLVLKAAAGNAASQHVAESNGFQQDRYAAPGRAARRRFLRRPRRLRPARHGHASGGGIAETLERSDIPPPGKALGEGGARRRDPVDPVHMTSVAGSPGRSASPTSGISLRDALIAIGVLIACWSSWSSRCRRRHGERGRRRGLVGVAAFSVTGLVAWHRRPTTRRAG